MLSLADGIQVDQIAALKPDLIVATNAGLDQDTYSRLSAIAPTIPQSGPDAFFEPWRDQATAIGQAVFHRRDAEAHHRRRRQVPTRARTTRSSPARRCCCSAAPRSDGRRAGDPARLAHRVPDPDRLHGPSTAAEALIPRDKMAAVLDSADVLIWTTESDEEQAALLADPTITGLSATTSNRNVFTGKELAGAIAYASTLSYPVVAEKLPPMIAKALG